MRRHGPGDAPGPGQRPLHHLLDTPARRDEQHRIGPETLRPSARPVGDDLRRHRADAAAADSDRSPAGPPAPVDEHRPFAGRGGEVVERPAGCGCDELLPAIAAGQDPPSVPRGFRPHHPHARPDQRLDLVRHAAPMVELDPDAVAEDQGRRVDGADGLTHPGEDLIAHPGRRGGEPEPVVPPAGRGREGVRGLHGRHALGHGESARGRGDKSAVQRFDPGRVRDLPADGRRPAPGPERREGPAQRITGMAVEQPRPLRLPERRRRCGGWAEKGVLPGAFARQHPGTNLLEAAEARPERAFQARRRRYADLGKIPLHRAFRRPRRRPEPGQREIPAGQDRQGGAVEPGPGDKAPKRRAETGNDELRQRQGVIIQGRHAASVPDVCAIPCVIPRCAMQDSCWGRFVVLPSRSAGGVGGGPLGVTGAFAGLRLPLPLARKRPPTRPPPQAGEGFVGGNRHRFQSMIVGITGQQRAPALFRGEASVSFHNQPTLAQGLHCRFDVRGLAAFLQADMGTQSARVIEPLHGAAFYRFAVRRPAGLDRNRRDNEARQASARHRRPERHRVKSVNATASVSVSSTAKLSRRPLVRSRASPAEPGLTTRTSPTRAATCIWVWP